MLRDICLLKIGTLFIKLNFLDCRRWNMGSIHAFNVLELTRLFNLRHYVETGTGEGLSLSHALTHNFETLSSIEFDKIICDNAINKFNDSRLTIYQGFSRIVLPEILPKFKDDNILFFLDAHFPGSDFKTGLNYIESVKFYKNDALPLKDELEVILKARPGSKDVFIIDDLRIYEENNYEVGNWEERKKIGIENASFIYDLFQKTHSINIILNQQGYLLITPVYTERDSKTDF